jgi:hypothetical protein
MILFAGSAHAETVTLDFQEYPYYGVDTYLVETQGYSLTSVEYYGDPSKIQIRKNGTATSLTAKYCPNCTLRLQNQQGYAFSISQVDLGYPSVSEGLLGSLYRVTGYFANGGSTQIDFYAGRTMRTYSFGSEWENLERVEFYGAQFPSSAVDNIVLTAVPVPAAVWLFGSALTGLGWLRRKQTV